VVVDPVEVEVPNAVVAPENHAVEVAVRVLPVNIFCTIQTTTL